MESILLTVLVTIAVSIASSLVTSLLAGNAQKIDLERKIQNQFTIRLYNHRIDQYPNAFIITDKILQKVEPQRIIEQNELRTIGKNLCDWKTGIVSLIISKDSLKTFYELIKTLEMNYGDHDKYTKEQVNKIIKKRNEFRGSLRRDIGLLYEEDEQFKE